MNYRIDHIGYLTGSISETAKNFETLGYKIGKTFLDDTQKTKICFLYKEGETKIELVEPYATNKTMLKMLSKTGVTPYHICFEVMDLETEYKKLLAEDWTALFKPTAAVAFSNRKICYFWNRELGFIELLNKE